MRLCQMIKPLGLGAALGLGLSASLAFAGAERAEWHVIVPDYADCVAEDVFWDADVREVWLEKVTSSGQAMFMDHWNFVGTVTGTSSGHQWTTRGIVQINDNYSLENSLTGKNGWLENALLKSQDPGVPDMRLDVRFHMTYNAAGELVVESFDYTYHCVGE